MRKIYTTIIQKKKVIFDICLNICAATLPIATLQLFIYPKVAKIIDGNAYGLMLTIYSIWMVLPFSLGNVLNNIKLLNFPKYQEIEDEGDIAVILRQWAVVSTIVVSFVIWWYCGSFSFVHVTIGTVIGILIFLKAYLEVGFRINLNYKAVLINNILLTVGFVIGYIVFLKTGIWECIFLNGYLFSSIYCTFKTHLLREKPKRTLLYCIVKKDAYSLLISVLVNSLTSYADKLILYPLMGGAVVSVYYTATILGKITGMLTGPINSVLLSYIAHWDNSKTDIFYKVLMIGTIVSILGYSISILISRTVIGLLFPQWLNPVLEIMPLTTVTIMLGVLATILNPFVLKYCKMHWQIGIRVISSVVYFGSALLLWKYIGLKGFCIGTIIGALTKLVIMIFVYYRSVKSANYN